MRRIVTLVMLLALAACGTMQGVFGPTEKFTATLCAEGAVLVPCKALGTISVPQGGEGLVSIVVTLAGPYLLQQANLKGCLFTTYPEAVGGGIVVTGTAACTLQGVPVSEKLTVTLAPVVAG